MHIKPLTSQDTPIPVDLRKELPDPWNPWTISARIFGAMQCTTSDAYKKVEVLPTDAEWRFIWRYFHHDKPTKYGLKRVYCVHDGHQTRAFENNISSIEREAETFKPTWDKEPRARQRKDTIARWQKATDVFSSFTTKESNGRTRTWNRTKVMPLWHGSSGDKCASICQSGFTYFGKTSMNLDQSMSQSTDEGYFGSGIYFTNSARYAADIYGNGCLILAWVSMREPFPVVGDFQQTDMKFLKGQGAYKNYNTHYVPVVPTRLTADCAIYYPCQENEIPFCDEVVVFQKVQTLTRFWVELEVELPYLHKITEAPLFVKEFKPYLFQILQHPEVDRDIKLRNVLLKELETLLKLQDDDDLNEQQQILFGHLTQLINKEGKIYQPARHAIISYSPEPQKFKTAFKAFTLLGHTASVQAIIVLKDNNLASCSSDGTIRLWKWNNAYLTLFTERMVSKLIACYDSALASTSIDGDIKLWRYNGSYFDCFKTLVGHRREITALIELSDGILASASYDKSIRLWYGGESTSILSNDAETVATLIERKDRTLASGSWDGKIRIWKRDGTCIQTLVHGDVVRFLIERQDGTLISGSSDGSIKLWKDSHKLTDLSAHKPMCTLIERKDGNLASGSKDGTIQIWKNSYCLQTLTGHTDWITVLVDRKDGSLASASQDSTIKIWSNQGICLMTLTGHKLGVSTLVELKDGSLASGDRSGRMQLWQVE